MPGLKPVGGAPLLPPGRCWSLLLLKTRDWGFPWRIRRQTPTDTMVPGPSPDADSGDGRDEARQGAPVRALQTDDWQPKPPVSKTHGRRRRPAQGRPL